MITKKKQKAIKEMIAASLSEVKVNTRPSNDATVAHPTIHFQILPNIDFMLSKNYASVPIIIGFYAPFGDNKIVLAKIKQ